MNIEQHIANKEGWFTPQEAASYYGHSRTLDEIVLHHWDTPSKRPSFADNLNYLLNPQNHGGAPTANTVIGWDESKNQVRIVDTVVYPNVAFTSSGATQASLKNVRAKFINCVSVGIEIDPFIESGPHRAELIQAVGYRVWQYRQQAGRDIPLTGHNTYVYTDCPGNVPFNEIERSAQIWAKGDDMSTPESVDRTALAMVYRSATPDEIKTLTGKDMIAVFDYYDNTPERKKINGMVWDYQHLSQTAQAQLNDLQGKLNTAMTSIKDPAASKALADIKAIVDKVKG